MSNLHTPGPWVWLASGDWPGTGIILINRKGEPPHPYGETILGTRSVKDADANLISAAPDLLEALQLVWDTYGLDPRVDSIVWRVVRGAISKATTP